MKACISYKNICVQKQSVAIMACLAYDYYYVLWCANINLPLPLINLASKQLLKCKMI